MRLVASRPSITGSMISMMTRSGRSVEAAWTALAPSEATRAVQPSAVMRCAMAVAKVGSSSTTRTVRGITVDCADELSIAFRLSQSSGFKNTAPSAGTVIFADQSRE